MATFSWVIGFSHMRLFIAGAKTTGQAAALIIRLTRSSRQAGGDFGDDVGRRGGDQHQIGPLGEGDVLGVGAVGEIEDVGADGAAGKGLEGERGDEFLGVGGHGDGDAGAELDEFADDVGDFIRGDAAADADDDLATFERVGICRRRGHLEFSEDTASKLAGYTGNSLFGLFRRNQPAGFVVDGDLVLEDFLDDDFQIGHVAALDQGAGAVHQFQHAFLDQGGELETAADFVHDFVALQCFDHSLFPFSSSAAFVFDDLDDFLDGAVEVVVNHHVVERPASFGHVNFTLGGAEAFGDFFGAVPATGLEPLQKCRLIGRKNEDQSRRCGY